MRAHMFRFVLSLVLLLAGSAAALAQSVMRGTVVDGTGKPVVGATVLFEAEGANRKSDTKTDNKGEYLIVGLQSGQYKITASKDGVGSQTLPGSIRQGPNPNVNFTLSAAAAPVARQQPTEMQKLATEAMALANAGDRDGAIAKYTEILVKNPTCHECYMSIALLYKEQQKLAEAEAAFKKVVEVKPDAGSAYAELATIYNSQKRFDLAAEASGNAAKYLGAAGGAVGGEALFNQGVIMFNSQKFPEAKTSFEAAVKADPTMAMAYYQLGMTALNLGQFADAVAALEAYLKLEPEGSKAPEVKASLPALQQMLKK